MKYPQYKPGARWQVRREDGRPEFDVTVLGPSNKSGYKKVRVEFVGQWRQRHSDYETEFSNKHMNTYFTYAYTEVICNRCDGYGIVNLTPRAAPSKVPCTNCRSTGKVRL